MFLNERYEAILAYLKKNRSATVKELSGRLYVSPATVRRDLEEMQKLGLLRRTHGGAIYYDQASEVSIFIRQESRAEEKRAIVKATIPFLPEFTSVFIDNSSTCLAFSDFLDFANKTVVTNGMQIASRISMQNNVSLFMPGGAVRYNTNAVTGEMTCDQIRMFRYDLMVCSCAKLDAEGCYEQDIATASIKKTAFYQSKKKILLVDQSKLLQNTVFKSTNPKEYDFIVTDADDLTVSALRQKGLNIYNFKR
ncbi:MAG: DeoR/GlpR transcriptional regulator [Clostridia bacterium]|nr:DeoR/GlpR transcriptional regulator [Clostridia bacterium]